MPLQTLPRDWRTFDLEKQSDFQSLVQDPDLLFRLNPDKIAIDEAQLQPELFSALCVAVDRVRLFINKPHSSGTIYRLQRP